MYIVGKRWRAWGRGVVIVGLSLAHAIYHIFYIYIIFVTYKIINRIGLNWFSGGGKGAGSAVLNDPLDRGLIGDKIGTLGSSQCVRS